MFCSLLPHQLNMMLGFDDLLLSKENNVVRKDLFDLRMYLTSSNNGQLMCGPTAVLGDKNDYLEEVWVSDLAVYPFGFILHLTPKIPVEYGTSIMDMFDANYTELCTFALPLMYLERYNEKFPLPLIFKKIAS